jgi:hypothetical protein
MIWGECRIEGDEVVVVLRGWRRILATRSTLRLPLASIVRVTHDPSARAHVKIGLRQWRKHGHGVWRVGVYHGLDGWSFWSIGLGRNAVLIECSGERFRYVVLEVADAGHTVTEIRTARRQLVQPRTRDLDTGQPAPGATAPRRGRRDKHEATTGED